MSEDLNFKIQRIHRLDSASSLKAFVDISINDILLIKGFRILEGSRGLFVSMPKDQGKDKKWYDTVKFLSRESRADVSQKIMEEYEKLKA